ncbi:MAG: DUF2974 domain-containing protein [Gammaproteobacteria bacterium]|nr:DUF2974 domain-containing protein [Gammaproteobacteria bacterium]
MNITNTPSPFAALAPVVPDFFGGIGDLVKVAEVTKKLTNFRDEVMPEEAPGHQAATQGQIYSPEQPPSVSQANDAAKKAKLSEDAYNNSGAPEGFTRVETVRDEQSGMAAVLYRNNQTNEMTIAYRGSEMGDADWTTNEQIGTNQVPKQSEKALEYVKSVQQRYPDANIDLTGHSLGGTLATMAGLYTGLETSNFDALGINAPMLNEVRSMLEEDGGEASDWQANAQNIDNYHIRGEFVGDSDGEMDAGTYGQDNRLFGDVFYLSDEHWNPDLLGLNVDGFSRPVSLHSMPAMIDELELLSNPALRLDQTDTESVGSNALVNIDDSQISAAGLDADNDLDQLMSYTTIYFDESRQSWQEDQNGVSNP